MLGAKVVASLTVLSNIPAFVTSRSILSLIITKPFELGITAGSMYGCGSMASNIQ